MSKSKDIGTRGETAVKRALIDLGMTDAERNALMGADDKGDLRALGSLVAVQVKCGAMAKQASLAQIDAWWLDTVEQARRANSPVPLLVIQRSGYGYNRAEYWRAFVNVRFVAEAQLLHGRWHAEHAFPVEMRLANAARLILGYGGVGPIGAAA